MTDQPKDMDGLGALADALAIRRSGWHRVENLQTGAVGFFPVAATDVDAWERKVLAQTEESERMERETRPEAKPLENAFTGRLRRGD